MQAGLQTFQTEFAPSNAQTIRNTPLQPQYRYLLLESGGQEALVVWIGDEPHPLGKASVWTSADGVIIRTVNGQLAGVTEPQRSWQLQAQRPLTTAPQATNTPSTAPTELELTVDIQPGHKLGLRQRTLQHPLPANTHPLPWSTVSTPVQWVAQTDVHTGQTLALYGMNTQGQTLAGERCMTPQWCVRWQTWPNP